MKIDNVDSKKISIKRLHKYLKEQKHSNEFLIYLYDNFCSECKSLNCSYAQSKKCSQKREIILSYVNIK